MVFIRFQRPINPGELVARLRSEGILANPPDNNGVMRLVTHYYIDADMVRKAADAFRRVLA